MLQSAPSSSIDLSTKKSCQDLLLSLIRPLFPLACKDGSLIHIPGRGASYPGRVIDMEAFARPLWGLVPFFIGGGKDEEIEAFYREGIANGCNPLSDGYWGAAHDTDQRFVELAPVAFALMALPGKFWDPLKKEDKDNVASYLFSINSFRVPACNWVFFRILINTALRKLGRPFSQERLDEDWAFIESNYIGNGWFMDGRTRRKDYYSAFAMQFYPLILSAYGGEGPKTKERAMKFAESFIHWFSPDGAALPYGRSLTYRFAECAFFSACLFARIAPFDKATMKGIINRNMRFFLSKEIFSSGGILEIGYGYPNHIMAEKYNAPGSPYWALKAFAFLALPDDDEYWQVEEKPLPQLPHACRIPEAEMLFSHRGNDTVMFTPGNYRMNNLGHFREKYFKFCYSTLFPFSVSVSEDTLENSAPDSTLAFDLYGRIIVTKAECSAYSISDNGIWMKWSPFPGIEAETEITIESDGHTRHHRIESSIECMAYDSAFAIDRGIATEDTHSIRIDGSSRWCSIESSEGMPYLINASPDTNLMDKLTCIPSISFQVRKGITEIVTRIRTGER